MKAALTALTMWLAGLAAGAIGVHQYHQSQPALPYTEPQQEFELDSGEQCVAWRFSNGAFVAICEGKPPVLRMPKRKCGLDL